MRRKGGEWNESDRSIERGAFAGQRRALYAAAEALEKSERFERRKQQLPAKTGEPWSEDEDRKLLSGFDAGRGLPDLAAAHQRTQTGVRARLVKYGRLAA